MFFQWEGVDGLISARILMLIDLTESKIINEESLDDDSFDSEIQNIFQLESNITSIHYLTSDKFAVIKFAKTEKITHHDTLKYSQNNIMFQKNLICYHLKMNI